jgi:hypothetical protein
MTAMTTLARDVELPEAPEPPVAEPRLDIPTPLVDSEDGYYATVEALKDRKQYVGEGEIDDAAEADEE